jgi:hypothetical protein
VVVHINHDPFSGDDGLSIYQFPHIFNPNEFFGEFRMLSYPFASTRRRQILISAPHNLFPNLSKIHGVFSAATEFRFTRPTVVIVTDGFCGHQNFVIFLQFFGQYFDVSLCDILGQRSTLAAPQQLQSSVNQTTFLPGNHPISVAAIFAEVNLVFLFPQKVNEYFNVYGSNIKLQVLALIYLPSKPPAKRTLKISLFVVY